MIERRSHLRCWSVRRPVNRPRLHGGSIPKADHLGDRSGRRRTRWLRSDNPLDRDDLAPVSGRILAGLRLDRRVICGGRSSSPAPGDPSRAGPSFGQPHCVQSHRARPTAHVVPCSTRWATRGAAKNRVTSRKRRAASQRLDVACGDLLGRVRVAGDVALGAMSEAALQFVRVGARRLRQGEGERVSEVGIIVGRRGLIRRSGSICSASCQAPMRSRIRLIALGDRRPPLRRLRTLAAETNNAVESASTSRGRSCSR